MTSRVPLLMVIAVGLLFSIACGGGKVGGTNPTGPFTIGGSVTGLTGTGLVLQRQWRGRPHGLGQRDLHLRNYNRRERSV